MDCTFVAIVRRLLGGRWSNEAAVPESSVTGEAEQGAGSQRCTQTIQGAFCSLTPEMGMWAEMESLQGPTLSQLADLQARIEALGPYTLYTEGGWDYGEME